MLSDEEWNRAPDWSKYPPSRIGHKKCDCPDFCERKVVGTAYDGTRQYWCRNCGEIYELQELRPLRLDPSKAVAQKLRACAKAIDKCAE